MSIGIVVFGAICYDAFATATTQIYDAFRL